MSTSRILSPSEALEDDALTGNGHPDGKGRRGRWGRQGSYFLEGCWLAHHGYMENGDPLPRCDGKLIRVHLIPKQLLKRVGGEPTDARSWVWSCGGPMGNAGHHGMLDSTRTLRVPYDRLPPHTIEYARQLGLEWWLERTYR